MGSSINVGIVFKSAKDGDLEFEMRQAFRFLETRIGFICVSGLEKFFLSLKRNDIQHKSAISGIYANKKYSINGIIENDEKECLCILFEIQEDVLFLDYSMEYIHKVEQKVYECMNIFMEKTSCMYVFCDCEADIASPYNETHLEDISSYSMFLYRSEKGSTGTFLASWCINGLSKRPQIRNWLNTGDQKEKV